jgi:ABC-type lipopolysaccharide export system ATPase subunit
VISDLSIEVESGQIVGLLGPNGAGKTTAFYMIVGLVPPDAGTVTVDGEEVAVPANPDAMRALAELTGGASFEAASADELQSVYDDISGDVSFVTEQRELVGPFLVAALVALSAAFGASLLWTARFL